MARRGGGALALAEQGDFIAIVWQYLSRRAPWSGEGGKAGGAGGDGGEIGGAGGDGGGGEGGVEGSGDT